MHTNEQLAAMKRTDLQRLAAEVCGRGAYRWTGPAQNAELIQAIQTGEVPERFRSGNGGDLAAAIAAAIGPLVQGQLDEDRVNALIDAKVTELTSFVEGKVEGLAKASTLRVEVKLPTGEIKHVGRQHKQFPQLVIGLRRMTLAACAVVAIISARGHGLHAVPGRPPQRGMSAPAPANKGGNRVHFAAVVE